MAGNGKDLKNRLLKIGVDKELGGVWWYTAKANVDGFTLLRFKFRFHSFNDDLSDVNIILGDQLMRDLDKYFKSKLPNAKCDDKKLIVIPAGAFYTLVYPDSEKAAVEKCANRISISDNEYRKAMKEKNKDE